MREAINEEEQKDRKDDLGELIHLKEQFFIKVTRKTPTGKTLTVF
ncbi:hypothetical protein ACU8V7_01455 [Zobellia nedashkovskayae]